MNAPSAAATSPPSPEPIEEDSRYAARLRRLGRLAELDGQSVALALGPGVRQVAIWSRLFDCRTLVVDDDPRALDALARQAAEFSVEPLVTLRKRSPTEPELLDLPAGSFDLIQSEGLAQAVGFDAAVAALRPLLLPDGFVALFQRTWISPTVPDEVRAYWEARHPGPLRTAKATLAELPRLGFEPMTCELAPVLAWDLYYERLEARLAALASGAPTSTPEGHALALLREEIRIHQEAGGRRATTVGCFVGRRREPGDRPRWPRRGFSE